MFPSRLDLAKGCATCPFHSGPTQSPPPSYPFCLYFFGTGAVICCDKAASTGGARVSRVEGHTASVRRLLIFEDSLGSRKGPRRLWYICNHVTRYVPFRYNCSPVTNCLRTFFFTLWPRARTYNTSRRRTEWESCRIPPCICGWKSVARRKREDFCKRNRLGIVRIIILLGTIRGIDRDSFEFIPFYLKIV